MFLRVYLNNCVLFHSLLTQSSAEWVFILYYIFLLQATLIKKKLLGNILCQLLFPEHSFQDLEFQI